MDLVFPFQSLIGILVDFDNRHRRFTGRILAFQSLIGILVDFDISALLPSGTLIFPVSIPDRDFS